MQLSFGPTPGWENFGGIIRDVWLITRGENYLADVFFRCRLLNDYRDAAMTVAVRADRPTEANIRISLLDAEGKCVLSYCQQAGASEEKRLDNVRLWSPDSPVLYTLSVVMEENGDVLDEYRCQVGFRELVCQRHRFVLNGKPLFLKGVCKHEMIGDSGHVVSPEMIERDMRMIKSTGANFVRLVHYPHNRAVLPWRREVWRYCAGPFSGTAIMSASLSGWPSTSAASPRNTCWTAPVFAGKTTPPVWFRGQTA